MRTEIILQTDNSFISSIVAEFNYKFYGHFDKVSKQLKWAMTLPEKMPTIPIKFFVEHEHFKMVAMWKGF